jgi:hypothetical protein
LETGAEISAGSPSNPLPSQAGWRPGEALTPLEQVMVDHAAVGEPVDLDSGVGVPDDVRAWEPSRTIRASVLRHLLIEEEWPVHSQGIALSRIRVSGDLRLSFATIRSPVILDRCYMDAVILSGATASLISLTDCRLGSLTGALLTVQGVNLSCSTFGGPVSLRDAKVGYLTCEEITLSGRDTNGNSLVADQLRVAGSASFSKSISDGAVRLPGAVIGGQLICSGFELKGCDVDSNALFADRIKIQGGAYLDQGFSAAGAVRLHGADVAVLNCNGAHLARSDRNGNALVADGIRVGGAVFLDEGFIAAGAVRLHSADIAVQLACRGAQILGRDAHGNVLVADGIRVGGSVFLDEGFTAGGTVSLKGARVGGSLGVMPGEQTDAAHPMALDASRAQITGSMRWAPKGQFTGPVNLQDAAVGQLHDDWTLESAPVNGYWPTNGLLCLHGFTYGALVGDHLATAQQRLGWIRSQYGGTSRSKPEGFSSQPYEQLANTYREAGQDTDARKVAIARRADLRRFGSLSWHRRAGNLLLDRTIKFGYQTWRALVLLAIIYGAFLALTVIALHHNVIVPTQGIRGMHPIPVATHCANNYPCFYPPGYAVDTVIPIINIHQADYWGLNGDVPWGWAWVASAWIATGLGWACATLLVAGYTGLVRTR